MAMSTYLKNKLLEHAVKNTAYTSPTTVYIALYTNTSGEPTSNDEIGMPGYARQAVSFGTASDGVISNSGTITFSANAGQNFGDITKSAILDASTGGNVLFYDDFVVSIVAGDVVELAAGDISITLE